MPALLAHTACGVDAGSAHAVEVHKQPGTAAIEPVAAFLRRSGVSAAEFDLIAGLPLFADLKRLQLVSLLGEASVREYPRGGTLFVQGDPAHRFFVVLRGWVRLVRYTGDDGEVTIALFGPGESLAEAAIFAGHTYPVTGHAVEESRVLAVPGESFVAHLRKNPDLALNMLATLARRLHMFVGKVEQIAGRSAVERVALFLLNLCHGEGPRCTIALPLDKTLIAARLGMQPETLSRALARLRRLGVETHGREVVIADVEALRRFAHAETEVRPRRA